MVFTRCVCSSIENPQREERRVVADVAVLLKTLKESLLSGRCQKKAKSAHAVGLLTEGALLCH